MSHQHVLTHLAVKEKVSASTQNQALIALLFLYRYVLDHQLGQLGDVGKDDKDRRTMLLDEVKPGLKEHLERVENTHARDLADGYGRVPLPYALDRKYPNCFDGLAQAVYVSSVDAVGRPKDTRARPSSR